MGDILDTHQLIYVAGISLLLNVVVFTITLVVYCCKTPRGNPDLEAATPNHGNHNDEDQLNGALLGDDEGEKQWGLIDLIPAMKFVRVVEKEKETTAFVGDGCAICLGEGFEEEEICKVLPECHHVFHSDCIDQWLKTKQNCPVCRKVFRVVVGPVLSYV
uniref:RING-type domain-containing protein n=1 Tax=Opuntia streptacantha TaxID=393608 RepID=A0A7C8ZUC2_OPUST